MARQFTQFSLSKVEMDAALEYSYDYISNVFNKQGRVLPFDLIYGDGTIHNPLNKMQTKALYDEMAERFNNGEVL